jgi:hypothetical protein
VAGTVASKQPFRIELISQQHPGSGAAVSGSLNVGPFESFEMSLNPRQLQIPNKVSVLIRNRGNAPSEYSLVGRAESENIQFHGEKGRISLQPGQSATVEIELEPRQQDWFGRSQSHEFEVEVTSRSGARQTLDGRAKVSPLMPVGIAYGGFFILVFICVLALLYLVIPRDGSQSSPTVAPGVVVLAQTATARSLTSTVVSVDLTTGATKSNGTVVPEGDRDNDGLSDSQEALVETDPDDPDSDNDLLSDGEEVLHWGTNPLNRDTDSDILLDGDEVNQYGTDPVNPDTDQDGFEDGFEIASGTDPNDPLDPVSTASPSPTQFTSTSTAEAQTPTTTATATATATTEPTSTATATPTPADTATPTPSSTSTPSPTSTATSTATSTPTATPTGASTPKPSVICAETIPEINGIFDETEWGTDPTITFQPDGDPNRSIVLTIMRTVDEMYMAFVISDPTENKSTDSLKVYIDSNGNDGDPDAADRFFQIARDGVLTIRSGLGSNDDGRTWDTNYTSDHWSAVVGEPESGQWIVEMQIDATTELPEFANGSSIGMMFLVLYGGSQGIWPDGAITDNNGTWQAIDNISCESVLINKNLSRFSLR